MFVSEISCVVICQSVCRGLLQKELMEISAEGLETKNNSAPLALNKFVPKLRERGLRMETVS